MGVFLVRRHCSTGCPGQLSRTSTNPRWPQTDLLLPGIDLGSSQSTPELEPGVVSHQATACASLASSIQFIDTALCCAIPFVLSYTDPDQKWIIRQHLINYPHMGSVVYVSLNSGHPIQGDHPFVDFSGATTSPYLQTWLYPPSNLSDLVPNLIKLFSHNHAFHYSTMSSLTHPLLPSTRKAMDRLSCKLHYDIVALRAKTTDEIEYLSAIQAKMIERVDITTSIIIGLEHERKNFEGESEGGD
ncbi:hypothetical protein LguiA_011552 [Lonicera macranthoides]